VENKILRPVKKNILSCFALFPKFPKSTNWTQKILWETKSKWESKHAEFYAEFKTIGKSKK